MKKDFSEIDRAVLASMDIREITESELDELQMFLPEEMAKGLEPGILLSEIKRRTPHELNPAPMALIAHYRRKALEFKRQKVSHVLPDLFRKDLLKWLSLDEVDVIDAALQGFEVSEEKNQIVNQKFVKKSKKMGISSNKVGKRTGITIGNFISLVAPILLAFRVPLASGEGSPLIEILETIRVGLGIPRGSRWVIRKLRNEAKEDPIYAFLILESEG